MVNPFSFLINYSSVVVSSLDQTKDLEDLNKTLQNRCDQLQEELIAMQDRYSQSLFKNKIHSNIKFLFFYSDQNQSSIRELKKENHFLKDHIHRLNAALSEYQTTHPPKTLKKDMHVNINQILCTRVIILSIHRKNNVECKDYQ